MHFIRGCARVGYVEGQNVRIESRWAEGQYDRLPTLARDLVRLRVAVIVITGGAAAALPAAKSATSDIPIVFSTGVDPVQSGFVASLHRPGSNVTGVTVFTSQLGAKRVQLARELFPKASSIGLLVNPDNPIFRLEAGDVEQAAAISGLQLRVITARTEPDFERAFATAVERRVDVLIVGGDPFFNSRRNHLVALAGRHAMPAIWEWREFVQAGGLISYGTSLPEMYRQVGNYTGRILKGDKPGELPVMQPTKFELVINLKTAQTLDLEISPTLLARADEVIE